MLVLASGWEFLNASVMGKFVLCCYSNLIDMTLVCRVIFRCDKAPLLLALSVGWLVGRSVCNAFVRRSTRRTLLAYLALFH